MFRNFQKINNQIIQILNIAQEMLLQQMLSKLEAITSTTDFYQPHYITSLRLAIIEKNPCIFVTDGQTCVQAVMFTVNKQPIRDDFPTPFNRLKSPYYNFQVKQAKFFNFNFTISEEQLQRQNKYVTPYSPFFYLTNKMEIFLQEKSSLTYKVFEHIDVSEWGLRIVNIANTGHYGVVMQIFQYSKSWDTFPIIKQTNLILYNSSIQNLLQKLRIRDIRNFFKDNVKNNKKGSLCYYMKNIKTDPIHTTKCPFVRPDKKEQILKNSKDSSYLFYVPIGNLEGVHRFTHPLMGNRAHSVLEKSQINFHKLNDLAEKRESGRVEIELLQSSEEDQGYNNELDMEEFEGEVQEEAVRDDDEDESSDEEPLRLIYKRQMESMSMI